MMKALFVMGSAFFVFGGDDKNVIKDCNKGDNPQAKKHERI